MLGIANAIDILLNYDLVGVDGIANIVAQFRCGSALITTLIISSRNKSVFSPLFVIK
jgi:hypothetical protein